MTELRYAFDKSRDLKGPLVAAALVADGARHARRASGWAACFRAVRASAPGAGPSAAIVLIALGVLAFPDAERRAQDAKPGDAEAMEAISTTRLAYVLTGDAGVDSDQPRRPCRV